MTRRRLPLALVVIGAVILLASVISTAIVRASDTVTLSLAERPEVPVVITEPGVLDAVDPTVTVRATAEDDEPVVLAVGRSSEVEAWLGDGDHVRVSGLSSWEELTSETVLGPEPEATEAPTAEATDDADPDAEQPAPGSVPNPAGSDLWVVETSSTGTAELSWTDSPGRWSLVAATDGTGPAPLVELEWGRQVSTPWLVPGVLVGAGLLVAGVAMLVLRVLADREQRRRDEAEARRQRGEELTDTGSIRVSVSDTDPGTGERLSRRQIREMERAMAEADRRRRAGEDVPPPIPFAEPGEFDPADGATSGASEERRTDPEEAASDAEAVVGAPDEPGAAPGEGDRTDVGAADGTTGTSRRQDGDEPLPGTEDEPEGRSQDGVPGSPGEEEEDLPVPSWRSVWGFADQTGPDDRPDHDREERR